MQGICIQQHIGDTITVVKEPLSAVSNQWQGRTHRKDAKTYRHPHRQVEWNIGRDEKSNQMNAPPASDKIKTDISKIVQQQVTSTQSSAVTQCYLQWGVAGAPEQWKWTFCHRPLYRCHTRVSSVCWVTGTPDLLHHRLTVWFIAVSWNIYENVKKNKWGCGQKAPSKTLQSHWPLWATSKQALKVFTYA